MRWRETELPEPHLNYEKIMAYRPADIHVSYGERDCIIYALGIGIGMDPLDAGELKFVYERAGLQAFPTMAVVLGWPGRMTDPAFGIDERLVVAGDLKVTLHRPLPVQAKLVSRPRVKEIIDKGPGNAAIIQNTRELLGEDGKPVATVDSSTFARKHGGFGGRMSDTPVPHADPQRAKAAGFNRPILHGAASFGVAARAVLRTCADDQPERLNTIEARFSRPVFPGDTIRTEMWRQGERVSFQSRVVSRNDVVLSNGLATLRT